MRGGPVVIATTALLLGACTGNGEPDDPLACAGGADPVSDAVLVETLARHGFELYREDECGPDEEDVAAMFVNLPLHMSEAEADVVWVSDGEVGCDLYRREWFGDELRRARTADTEEVLLRVLNVECRIYEAHAWQVERLAVALEQLPKAAG